MEKPGQCQCPSRWRATPDSRHWYNFGDPAGRTSIFRHTACPDAQLAAKELSDSLATVMSCVTKYTSAGYHRIKWHVNCWSKKICIKKTCIHTLLSINIACIVSWRVTSHSTFMLSFALLWNKYSSAIQAQTIFNFTCIHSHHRITGSGNRWHP